MAGSAEAKFVSWCARTCVCACLCLRMGCQICHGCHRPDRMTAVTKEIGRRGGERRDTASREHTLGFKQGLKVVSVCVYVFHVCVCAGMFVCDSENGCMSMIGLCFSNVHAVLTLTWAVNSLCIKKKQRGSVGRLCVYKVCSDASLCVYVCSVYWVWPASLVYIVKSMLPIVVRPAFVVPGDTLCVCLSVPLSVWLVIVTLGRESDTGGRSPLLSNLESRPIHQLFLLSIHPFPICCVFLSSVGLLRQSLLFKLQQGPLCLSEWASVFLSVTQMPHPLIGAGGYVCLTQPSWPR